jgi:hypothetical protein
MNESSFDRIKSSCTIEAAKEMEELGGESLVQDRALGSKSNGKQKAAPYLWGAGIPGRETEGQHNCEECGGKRSSEQQCGRKNGENKTTTPRQSWRRYSIPSDATVSLVQEQRDSGLHTGQGRN